jgi:hypothetical protein
MQVRSAQLQDVQTRASQLQAATESQLEALQSRALALRLRTSDLQAREQQIRELRYQAPPGPERASIDTRWLRAKHDLTAATLELESLDDRIRELRTQRDQARAVALSTPPAPAPPPVEVNGLANAWSSLSILFMAPIVVVVMYRLWMRGAKRDPLGLESSPRLERMEQAIESIALQVEVLAEGQRFTTKLLAERQVDAGERSHVASLPGSKAIAPK